MRHPQHRQAIQKHKQIIFERTGSWTIEIQIKCIPGTQNNREKERVGA